MVHTNDSLRVNNSLRVKMLLTTAAIAFVGLPGVAYAQLVDVGDLVDAVDSIGNPGQITIANPTATTATIDVLAPTVIADWVQFNVPVGTTLDINNASVAAQATFLNRVIGGGASDISGTINASDVNLWLINQNGILFGSTASVNASSFVASTLDVTDGDFLNFAQSGGSSSVNFAQTIPGAAGISSAGGTITTDGTLFFASQALDLAGTFDAGTGRAAFVAASDVDVQFDAGSPLNYTITGGTTVAQQSVDGSVSGSGVDFQMVSAAGVVGALLQIDASVTATTAVATETGILLQASGLGAGQPSVRTNGTLNSTGVIDIDVGDNFTATDTITGSSVSINALGDVTATTNGTVGGVGVDITSTGAGSVLEIDAAGRLVAGDLSSDGNIATNSGIATSVGTQRADGSITGDSGATYDSGLLTAGTSIDVESTGDTTIAGYRSGSSTDIISSAGNVDITAASRSAGDSTLTSARSINTLGIVTTAGGDINLNAGRDLTSEGILNADGNVSLDGGLGLIDVNSLIAGGNIATMSRLSITARTQSARGSVTGVAGGEYTSGLIISDTGPIDVTSTDTARIAGYRSGGAASVTSLTDDVILTASSTSVGDTSLTANNGSVLATTTGTVGGPRVVVSTTGAESLLNIDAGERIVTGNLLSGGDITTQSGLSTSVDLQRAFGSITGVSGATYDSGLMTATNGFIDVMSTGNTTIAGYMSGGDTDVVSSTGNVHITAASVSGGDSTLTSTIRSVNTQGITSTGGNIDLNAATNVVSDGDLTAFGDVTVDANRGLINVGNVMAGGDIATISGLATTTGTQMAGGSVTGEAGTTYTSDFIKTTIGSIDVESGSNATIAGYMSGDTATVLSRGANVILTADASSVGTSSLTSDLRSVTTQMVTTTDPNADINIDAATFVAANGDLVSSNDINVDAGTSVRATGVLMASNDVNVDAGTSIFYTSIDAGNNIDLMADTFISGGIQTAGGSVTGNAVTNYTSGRIAAAGPIDVVSGGTAIIAGYDSDSTATILSTGGNVFLTDDASSAGTSSLTSNIGFVNTQDVKTTGASADIVIDAGTSVRANGVLMASNDVDTDANTSIVYTSIMAGNDIDLMAGTLVSGGTQTAAGSVTGNAGTTYNSGFITTTNGSIDVTSAGDTTIAGYMSGDTATILSTGGNVLLTADASSVGTSSLTSNIGSVTTELVKTTGPNADIDIDAGTFVKANGDLMSSNDIDVDAGTSINYANMMAVNDIDLDAGTSITGGALNAGGDIETDSGAGTSTGAQTAGGSITGNAGTTYNSGILTATNGTISITGGGLANIDDVPTVADANNTADDVLSIAGIVSGTTTSLTVTSGDIVLSTPVTSDGGLNLNAFDGDLIASDLITTGVGSDINLVAANTGNIRIGSLNSSGDITTNSTGETVIGTQTAAGSITGVSGTTYDSGLLTTNDSIDVTSAGDATINGYVSNDTVTVLSTGGDVVLTADASSFGTSTLTSNTGLVMTEAVSTIGMGADIVIDTGTSVTTGDLSSSGAIDVDGAGAVNLVSANAVDRVVIGATTPPSSVTITGVTEGVTVDVTASGLVDLNTVNSTGGDINLVSEAGSITVDTANSVGGDVALMASTDVTAGTLNSSGAIDVDSSNGGTLNVDTLNAGTTIDLDTGGSVIMGAITAGTVLRVGANTLPSDVLFTGAVDANSIDLSTSGTFTAEADVNAATSTSISSSDIDLAVGSSLSAPDVLLRVTSSGQVILGEGTGVYVLNNDELSRIVTSDIVIDAQSNNVSVDAVTFTDDTGSNSFNVATVGEVNLIGDVTADGADRTFRFGGLATPDGTGDIGLASRITADVDNATYDFGASTVELRGVDIVFGREAFVESVEGRSNADVAATLIGNSVSSLFDPLLNGQISDVRLANPVYLRVGNLVVVYDNTALFQNSGSRTGGLNETSGVNIGSSGGNGTLTIETTDNSNAFALFGQINDLIGDAVAVAGPTIVIINESIQLGASRINGCQLGSGADCISTEVTTTIVDIPRETINLLGADSDLSVPFDPLVGTNNEGLFSDAASNSANQDCQRNDSGDCVAPRGSQ